MAFRLTLCSGLSEQAEMGLLFSKYSSTACFVLGTAQDTGDPVEILEHTAKWDE